jgi:hypothetical protein
MAKKPPELILTRKKNGDWSLCHPDAKKQKLLSGTANESTIVQGKWDRPIKRDYELAWMMYTHFIARSDDSHRD